jgi:hypothetical protein
MRKGVKKGNKVFITFPNAILLASLFSTKSYEVVEKGNKIFITFLKAILLAFSKSESERKCKIHTSKIL